MVNLSSLAGNNSIPEILKRPSFILSILIVVFTLLLIVVFTLLFVRNNTTYIHESILYFIYIISFVPLIVEIKEYYMDSQKVSTKINIKSFLSSSIFLKPKYILLLFFILVFSLSPLYVPTYLEYQMNDYSKSQSYQTNINDLSNQILFNDTNDYDKMHTLYNWTNCNSKNIANIYSKETFIRIYPLHIYLTEPYYCIRLIEHQNPEWVIKSHCGACEEFSQLFMLLANNSNLTVRSVHNHGYDHNWDEVLIENEWIIVDPSMPLFDINPSYYEENLYWVSTYVFAIYPNGTKEDITSRYTNVSNLTVRVIDENLTPISNASIFLFSNNHPLHKEINTTFQARTNLEGEYLIEVGGGNYTLVTEKLIDGKMYSNKTTLLITENKNVHYDLVLEKDKFYWFNRVMSHIQRFVYFSLISIYSLFLWVTCVIYFEYKKITQ